MRWKRTGWMGAGGALAGTVLLGCLPNDGGGKAAGGKASLSLALAPAALLKAAAGPAAPVDSLRIRITGEDMEPIEFARRGDTLSVALDGLPPGEDRLVCAWLYRQGRLLYAGQAVYDFRLDAPLRASLACEPQFSRVTALFHLPQGLPSPVRSGLLRLRGAQGEFSAALELRGEFGAFRADELPGNARYDVVLTLSDSLGRERYRAERAGAYLPLGEEARWDLALAPTEASAGLSLDLSVPKETSLRPGFPAGRRGPSRPAELIVLAFFAAPAAKDSGSEGEWFSLFNRTGDTLALEGCRIARDGGTGATRSFPFPQGAAVAPGGVLSFGRRASRAGTRYDDFSLANTPSSLLLLCSGDSLVADSLRYSPAAADSASALPMKEGWVTRLSTSSLGTRDRPSSWCLARPEEALPDGWGECP